VRELAAALPGLLLIGGAAAAVKSVPFYAGWIVATYVVLWVALAVALVRGRRVGAGGRYSAALVLAAAGVVTYVVPTFTYVASSQAGTVRGLVALGTLATAVALAVVPRWHRVAALALAVVVFVAGSAAVIRLDPTPHIDVWYMLQGAADGLVHGQDMYTQVWPGSPGQKAAFTYLPWTAVLLAPARLVAGDVRWGLVVAQLLAAAAVVGLAGRSTAEDREQRLDIAAGAAALLLLLPGTLTQIEQAWTEPLIFLLVALAVLAVAGERRWLAVGLVALALASKQHIALLLPVLAVWRPFGVRRAIAAAAGGVVLVLPWALWNFGAMWHDTITLLVGFHPILFADTLYLAAMHELGWIPTFWLTGALVLAVVAGCGVAVRRLDPSPLRFPVVAAVALFGANLLNKQAFYNQFWLVGALVLLAWPSGRGDWGGDQGPAEDADRARRAPSEASQSTRIQLTSPGASSGRK
jgi:Glycosyltransferase family 87